MRKQGFLFKAFACFLCVAFFLLTGRFSPVLAAGKGRNIPIGEMVSRGEVKFEAREKIWKEVEPSYFPVFPGVKIKTGKGAATISLGAHYQMEMGQNSIICFEQKDQLRVYRGRVDFRISGQKDLSLRAGNLIVISPLSLHAAQSPGVIHPKAEEVRGSLLLLANGSLSLKSTQGQLTVLDQERKVLAVLAPKDSLTIPSIIVEKPAGEKALPVMIAQVGDEEAAAQPEKYVGLSAKTWGVIGLVVLGVGGILAVAGGGGGGGGGGGAPICR
jgi:hypothetical protein